MSRVDVLEVHFNHPVVMQSEAVSHLGPTGRVNHQPVEKWYNPEREMLFLKIQVKDKMRTYAVPMGNIKSFCFEEEGSEEG